MSKRWQWAANILLGIAVLLLAGVLVAPRFTGLTLDTVLSGSMEPSIHTGALIGIAKADPSQIEVGDIIAFHVAGMDTPVCHRVVEIVPTESGFSFRTKGDANNDADPWTINSSDVVGRVYFNVAWVGYAARYFKTPQGFIVMMGIPAILVVFLELKGLLMPAAQARRRPKIPRKSFNLLPFAPFLGAVAVVTLMWALMAGNNTEKTLTSLVPAGDTSAENAITAQRTMQNKGKMPLVICLSSSDPGVVFSETSFELAPGQQKQIEIKGENGDAIIHTGGFFPILPVETLAALFNWSPLFSPLVAVVIWVFPLSLIAFMLMRLALPAENYGRKAKYFRGVLNNG